MHQIHTLIQLLRGDIRHLPRVVVLTIMSMALYNFGWGFADPYFSLYLESFTNDYTVIGFFQTLALAAAFLMTFPVGDLLDRTNHFRLMIFAKCGYAVVGILYLTADILHSIPLLIIALLLNGFFMPFVWTGTIATLEDHTTKKHAAMTFGMFVTGYRIAWMLGLTIAVVLVRFLPIYIVFVPVIIFPLLSALFNRRQPDANHKEPILSALKDIIVKDKIVVHFYWKMKQFSWEEWMVYAMYFVVASIQVMGLTFLPLYARYLGYSISAAGTVLLTNIPFLFSVLFAETADHKGRLRNVIMAFAISGITAFLLSLFSSSGWLFVLIAVIFMVGHAMSIPALTAIISILTSKKSTGSSAAFLDIAAFGGAILFAPGIGLCVDIMGWRSTFILYAVFLLCMMFFVVYIQYLFKKRNILYHNNHPRSKREPYVI